MRMLCSEIDRGVYILYVLLFSSIISCIVVHHTYWLYSLVFETSRTRRVHAHSILTTRRHNDDNVTVDS
jgi:hypothetical protein